MFIFSFVGQTLEANDCFFKIVDLLNVLPEDELSKLASYYFEELKPTYVSNFKQNFKDKLVKQFFMFDIVLQNINTRFRIYFTVTLYKL